MIASVAVTVVLVVADILVNSVILGPTWASVIESLGLPPLPPSVGAWWILTDFITAVSLCWLLVNVGVQRWVQVAIVVWSLSNLGAFGNWFEGVWPLTPFLIRTAFRLVSTLGAAAVGKALLAKFS